MTPSPECPSGWKKKQEVNSILDAREKTHGDWNAFAHAADELIQAAAKWDKGLPSSQRIALDMILVKMARVLCGNPLHKDHWDDIAGYAQLVARTLK